MITFAVPDLVVRESVRVCDAVNFGRRGFDDGSKLQQLHGIISQNSMALAFGFPFVKISDTWDGGFDFKIGNEKIDVKTRSCITTAKSHYETLVVSDQIRYDVQIYLFTSYNFKANQLTVCGWLPKDLFLSRSRMYKRGEKILNDSGKTFLCKLNTHQIYYYQLNKVENSLEQLKEDIEMYSLFS